MKTYRVIAALLALVMLLGMFSGCSKNGSETTDPANPSNNPGTKTETNDEKAASTSKYAYQAEYLPIPENIQYVNTSTISGSNLYFTGSIIDGKKTYTDENGEETEYDNYRSALFKMDVETGDCTELTEFQLPEVPEGWMGSTDLNTIQAGADGTLWAIYGSYTYRYNPPADLAEDDSMYNYYEEGENKTGLLHLDADGKEIKRIEFSQTDEDGNSLYVSSFFVDNSGNVYLSDWQNVYIYDQDGNKKTTVDLGENGGDLCELKAGVVGVSYYKNDEAKPEESGRVFQEIDPATGKLTGDTVKLPDSAYRFFPGDDVYDIYYDYNGNIYGYKFDTDTKDKVIDWIECDINSNNINSYSILPDGRVIAFENSYDDGMEKNTMQLIVMTRVDAASVVNKTVLTFACMYLDWNMRDAIVKFNRASNTHRIVVRDYSEYNTDDDYNAGIQKLNTEMLSGKLPFDGDDDRTVALKHLSAVPTPLREIAPSVPEALEKIVMKAMEASLDNRYQTADALAADLEALQKSLTGSLDRIEGNVAPLSTAGELGREDYVRRRRRAHRVSMLSGFFGVMAAILIIAVFLWNYFLSDIFVVNQRVAIPNFVGSNYETIINSKEFKGKYNFDLIYEIDPNVERGIIIGQSPDAGKSYMLTSDGIHVTLTVSTGVMLTEIPNLLNYDYREATSELEKLGFVVDKTFADSDDVAADCVMQISPSPGEKLPAGSTVYLTISQGAKTETVIMPYLVGKDYATAEAELAAARLTLVSVSYVYNNTIPVDYVVSQTVEAGTEIPAYSKIYLQISLGPETTPTPSPSPVPTQDPNAE